MRSNPTTNIHSLPDRLKRRSGLAHSKKVQAKMNAIRTWAPLVVTGVTFKERKLIGCEDYPKLDVDPGYQRGRTGEVSMLITAIQAGGTIADIPDVALRPWEKEGERYYIMDGFQRISALMECNKHFFVNVWVVDSIEAEKRFFLALNNRKNLNTSLIVKSWDGPVSLLLRTVAVREGHALCNRIKFSGGYTQRLSSAMLAQALLRFHTQKRTTLPLQIVLSKIDGFYTGPGADAQKRRASKFLELVGLAIPAGSYATRMGMYALAEVAAEHWPTDVNMFLPTESQIKRLAAINWRTKLPSQSADYMDLAVSIVRRIWK